VGDPEVVELVLVDTAADRAEVMVVVLLMDILPHQEGSVQDMGVTVEDTVDTVDMDMEVHHKAVLHTAVPQLRTTVVVDMIVATVVQATMVPHLRPQGHMVHTRRTLEGIAHIIHMPLVRIVR